MPSSTIPVIVWIDKCDDWFFGSMDRVDDNYTICLENGLPLQECQDGRDEEEQQYYQNWEMCLKDLPEVDYSCVEQLQPFSREHDSDGDGIADFWEYLMSTNPCEKCSYGGTPGVDCDGDLDWDRDDHSNADDYFPTCGQIWREGEWDANPEGTNNTYCV